MKKILIFMLVTLLLTACASGKETTSGNKEVKVENESTEKVVSSKSNEKNTDEDNNSLVESTKNKETVVMKFGNASEITSTTIDAEELPFFDNKTESVSFGDLTLERPFEWSFEGSLSYLFEGRNGTSALLMSDGGYLSTVGTEMFTDKTLPAVIDKDVLGASQFTSLDFGTFFLKKGESGTDVFEYGINQAIYPMGNIDSDIKSVKWMSADTNTFFVGYFDSNSDFNTKGYTRKSNEVNTEWTEIKIPQVDSEIVTLGDKGYYVSLKEESIMSVDKKGNVEKVTKLSTLKNAKSIDSFRMHTDGTWAVYHLNDETFESTIETPNKIFTFEDGFMGIDFLSKDYFVAVAGVVGLIVNANTGEYLPIGTELMDIAATDSSDEFLSNGKIVFNNGFTAYVMNYKIEK